MPPQKKASPQAEATAAKQTAPPQAEPTTVRTPPNWYTDTLRTIVNRALDAEKPDIKGALAALAMLAEAEEPADDTDSDIASLLRDARKRAAHAKAHTE